MLDDLKYIHHMDAQDALGIAEKQYQQLEHSFDSKNWQLDNQDFYNIVIAGMGGSALAGLISASWPGYKLPFEIVRGYDIPAYVGPATLFVASSYSGNTEETLTALGQAESAKAQIVILASGGKLAQIAKAKHYPLALLPDSHEPRFGVLYSLKALVTVLEEFGLTDAQSAEKTMHKSAEFIKKSVKAWTPEIPTAKNPAKKLALEIMGRAPVIYAGPKLFPAAYKWKISFNENAKNLAWCNQYSEFNHNEMLGWTSHPVDKPYTVIELRSNLEHPRIQRRFEVSERLLSGQRSALHVIDVQGKSLLEQLLWSIALGDFVSLYLALLNGLNPTPVDLIEKFKKSLDT